MSAREWKPGDVAMVTCNGESLGLAFVAPRPQAQEQGGVIPLQFLYLRGGFDMVDDLAPGTTVRPLLVLDPEDREQVERVAAAWFEACGWQWSEITETDRAINTGQFQAALRSLLTRPKPPEPQGRYAVVEDRSALEWVRADLAGSYPWKCLTVDKWSDYESIDAVEVLSEGVQP